MRTATKFNRNEPVPTKAKQWEFADLSLVRTLLDIACSSSRAQFWRPRSGKWEVECREQLIQIFLGGREGMKERRKVVKHATATAIVSQPLLVSEQTLIVL